MMINNQQFAIPTGRARVSILERLAPSLAFALVALSGAAGALAMQRFFRAMRVAESAGYLAYYLGMSEVHLLIGVVLAFAVVVGFAGILVAAIRMFTENKTASPPGVVFLIPGGISLISPLIIGYAGAVANLALEGRGGGLVEVGTRIAVLNWTAVSISVLALIVLMVFTFVPFRAKTGRRFTPVIFLILLEGVIAAAAVAFFLEMQMCRQLAEAHY